MLNDVIRCEFHQYNLHCLTWGQEGNDLRKRVGLIEIGEESKRKVLNNYDTTNAVVIF